MKRLAKFGSVAVLGIAIAVTAIQGCKSKVADTPAGEDAEVAFAPVAVGAAYGVSLAANAAVAASAVYAADCVRPVPAGEIRFFCDGGMRLGQAAVGVVVRTVQTLAKVLHWSNANIVAYLSGLDGLSSNGQLKSALAGTSNPSDLAGARVSPRITSESGRANLVHGIRQSIRIQDRDKRRCDYVAQYEARVLPRNSKAQWMDATSMRFFAKAPSPESAELMALHLCEEYTTVHLKLAPGVAGIPASSNGCRKPRVLTHFKEKFRTDDIGCPGVRVCASETDCFDLKL